MNELKVRSATEADAVIVCDLLRQMRGENYDFNKFKMAYDSKLTSARNAIFVVEYKGEVVGIADVSLSQYLVPLTILLTVENIIIDEKCRGMGIGKYLMDYIVVYAKKNNCNQITLVSGLIREKAHKFYENYGFDKTGYRFDYKIL